MLGSGHVACFSTCLEKNGYGLDCRSDSGYYYYYYYYYYSGYYYYYYYYYRNKSFIFLLLLLPTTHFLCYSHYVPVTHYPLLTTRSWVVATSYLY